MPKKVKPVKNPEPEEPIDTIEIEPLVKESTRYNNYQYLLDLSKNRKYKII